MQIEQGNLIQTFRQYQQHIGLIHIADNPGRHEPGTGEINYATICKALAIEKYKGVVAFELSPETTFEAAAAAVMSLHSIE
jgi:hydroxypyruvate isomerase